MSMYVKIAPYYAGAAGPSSIVVLCRNNFITNGGTPYLSFFYEIDARASGSGESEYVTIPLTDPRVEIFVPKTDRGWYYSTIPNTLANNRKYARFNYKNYTLVNGKQEYVPGIKEEYVAIIKALYGDNIENNTPAHMTPEVIAMVDIMLDEIKEKSKAMVGVEIAFNLFYGATSWTDLALNYAKIKEEPGPIVPPSIEGWINVLLGNKNYDTVVRQVAYDYKSALQITLITSTIAH